MNKKSQAIDFIMTYGWAILVVLVAIAALAYFGGLSPNKSKQEEKEFIPVYTKECVCFGCRITFNQDGDNFSVTPSTDYIEIECCHSVKQIPNGSCYYGSQVAVIKDLSYRGFNG
ncbi:hypothetical protein HY448_01620 [Candidatus Pacearchaeota archaeon]|nr:hypothetical protein [Candidatus Pacearchaeota archaeon]